MALRSAYAPVLPEMDVSVRLRGRRGRRGSAQRAVGPGAAGLRSPSRSGPIVPFDEQSGSQPTCVTVCPITGPPLDRAGDPEDGEQTCRVTACRAKSR